MMLHIHHNDEWTIDRLLPICSICYEQFDIIDRLPKLLPCGHNFCDHCLLTLLKPIECWATCPSCRLEFTISADRHHSLPINFALLEIIDKIISYEKNNRQRLSLALQMNNDSKEDTLEHDNERSISNEQNRIFDHFQKCFKRIHGWMRSRLKTTFICISIIFLLCIIPYLLISSSTADQSSTTPSCSIFDYSAIDDDHQQSFDDDDVIDDCCSQHSSIDQLIEWTVDYFRSYIRITNDNINSKSNCAHINNDVSFILCSLQNSFDAVFNSY